MITAEKFKTKKENGAASEYLVSIKDWKIRLMVAYYLEAGERFKAACTKSKPLSAFPFREIGLICDILYQLKEEHHLIFKRVVGPEKIKQEDRHKIEPTQSDIDFIANIGMLFHKMLVARELKYIFMHYDPLSAAGSNAEEELIRYLQQIHDLFEAGVPILISFISRHSGNIPLLSLLLENATTIKKSTGLTGVELLKKITGQNSLEAIYFLIGKYYMESGWYNRAEKVLKKISRSNPKNVEARSLLNEVKVRAIALKPKSSL